MSSWSRIDDDLADDPRMIAALDEARGAYQLYVAAHGYAHRWKTAGVIDNGVLERLGHRLRMSPRETRAAAKALVRHDFWSEIPGGHSDVDFEDSQPDQTDGESPSPNDEAARLQSKREKSAARSRRYRQRKAEAANHVTHHHAHDSVTKRDGVTLGDTPPSLDSSPVSERNEKKDEEKFPESAGARDGVTGGASDHRDATASPPSSQPLQGVAQGDYPPSRPLLERAYGEGISSVTGQPYVFPAKSWEHAVIDDLFDPEKNGPGASVPFGERVAWIREKAKAFATEMGHLDWISQRGFLPATFLDWLNGGARPRGAAKGGRRGPGPKQPPAPAGGGRKPLEFDTASGRWGKPADTESTDETKTEIAEGSADHGA